jgi:hypothetical protein
MKRKLISMFSLFVGFLGYSQTEVYFKYDEAGNQRYRGPNINGKQTSELLTKDDQQKKTETLPPDEVMDEKTFWKEIRLYPVPVNNYLTIDWTDKVDDLIENVSIYQHSTAHWKFQKQNIPSLNKQLKIDMTSYYWGVYILQFTLKDGRIFTKNITKR